MFFYIQEAYSLTKNLEINKLLEEPTKTYNNQRDVESLGLDNVEHSPKIVSKIGSMEEEIKKAQEAMKSQIIKLDENQAPPEIREFIKKAKDDYLKSNPKEQEIVPIKPTDENIVDEIKQNKIEESKKIENITAKIEEPKKIISENKVIENPEINKKPIANKKPKSKLEKKVNLNPKKKVDKKDLEKQEVENKARQEQQRIEQEFQKKLNDSRRLYLNDLVDNQDKSDEEILASEKIAPVKKSLTPFAVDELPAIPILNRSRSEDNYHIPFIYTPKEYIDILFSAISMGSISYFNEAFKYVLNPNISNDQGDTILTYAIFLRKYSIIASVLAKGADPNLPNLLGYNPVHLAIEMNDYVTLDMLEKNNADMFYIDGFGRTYLALASKNGFLPAVDLFVKKGVNINEMDNDGFTALSLAYRNKHELVVKYLLKNGAKTWTEKEFIPQKRNFINELKNRWK